MKTSLIMTPFLIIFLFFFTSDDAPTASATSNLIQETCKKSAATDPNLDYNFCVTSFEADPGSEGAKDLQQLGHNAIELAGHNVTSTKSYIEELLKKKLDPFVKTCLQDCLELYSDAEPALKEAMEAYEAKHYNDANIKVSSVLDGSTTCEDGFKEKSGVVSPLTQRNYNSCQLSVISLSIINMLG